jgi:glycosyltransferase involved in cell wall biosynthesis
LHIVYTESSLGWGGQELRVVTEAQGMVARGDRVTLLTPRTAPIYEEANRHGIVTQALPIASRQPAGVMGLRRWMKPHPADILSTHSSVDSWLVALVRSSLRHPPPQVRTRHISAPVSRGWASRWLYTRATDYIITTGESLRQTLVRYNDFPVDRIRSIPTGIDLTRFTPRRALSAIRQELGLERDSLLLTTVATLRSWKGHSYLLEAFATLKTSFPHLSLLIVGDGPQWESLRAQVRKLKLIDVHMVGRRRDVPEILAGSDLFALPSWANEGIPQALLQAMAMGLPMISTPIGAIPEAVVDGETGILVIPKSTTALADAIATALHDPAQRAALGRAARQRVQKRFSLEAMLDQMEQVFHAVSRGWSGET